MKAEGKKTKAEAYLNIDTDETRTEVSLEKRTGDVTRSTSNCRLVIKHEAR